MENIFSVEKAVFKSVHTMSGCAPGKSPKERFIEEVVDRVCDFLGRKNVSKSHKSALNQLAKVMADVVIDFKSGKWVSTLPAGTGKSTFMCVVIAVAHKNGYSFPSCICVENLDELEATYLKLIDSGVKKEDIACTFNSASLKGRESTIKSTDPDKWSSCRVLLCCHAVVNEERGDWPDRINSNWGQRFVFYDEELKRGQVLSFKLGHLEKQINDLSPYLSKTVKDWLSDALEALQSSTASIVRISPCPSSAGIVIKSAKGKYKLKTGMDSDFPAIEKLAKEGVMDIYKLANSGGISCVAIAKKLPPIGRALVLDASYASCPYAKWDADISVITTKPFKKYSHVKTIATGRRGSKDYLIENEFEESNRLKSLLMTLKDKGKRVLVICVKKLESAARLAGATNVLTYGKHRGTNRFKDFDTVILFGMYYPSPEDAIGHVLLHGGFPEMEDMSVIGWKRALVEAYQAVNRTVMRNSIVDERGETQSKKQTIYLFMNPNKTQQKFWQKMLPESTYITEGIAEQANRVLTYLGGSIETREKKADIRKKTGLRKKEDGVSDRQWREVVKAVVEQGGWIDDVVWMTRSS